MQERLIKFMLGHLVPKNSNTSEYMKRLGSLGPRSASISSTPSQQNLENSIGLLLNKIKGSRQHSSTLQSFSGGGCQRFRILHACLILLYGPN
jgi:hypothetical protein